MNKKLFALMVGGAVLTGAAQASALTVTGNTNNNIQVTVSSSDQMHMNASDTMDASGTMYANDNGGSLEAQVTAGTLSASSNDAIVSLQGDSVNLIKSNDDLSAYNKLVIKSRPAVKEVNVNSDNSVDVHYAQPAKFLGIFSTSLSGKVHVDAKGSTSVNLPWYSFLYSKDTTSVETSATTAVQQSGAQFNTQADATTMAQDHARVINAVSTAVQQRSSASASASGSTNY